MTGNQIRKYATLRLLLCKRNYAAKVDGKFREIAACEKHAHCLLHIFKACYEKKMVFEKVHT